jgi:hypothetical protein
MPDKDPSDSTPDYMADKFIALRAYEYWEKRGSPFGSPTVDWFKAIEDIKDDMTRASGTRFSMKEST